MPDKKIALTGGIASGKTTVANEFRKLGAIILDADEYARQATEPGTDSYQALRELIGPDFFNSDETLKRAELRRRIAEDPALRKKINSLLHPYVIGAMRAEGERQTELNPDAVIIFDIPLLFEAGFDKNFDFIILVYSPPQVQIQRLIQRDRLPLLVAESNLSMQLPIDSKKALSDYVIDNSGDLESTFRQVREIWEKISR